MRTNISILVLMSTAGAAWAFLSLHDSVGKRLSLEDMKYLVGADYCDNKCCTPHDDETDCEKSAAQNYGCHDNENITCNQGEEYQVNIVPANCDTPSQGKQCNTESYQTDVEHCRLNGDVTAAIWDCPFGEWYTCDSFSLGAEPGSYIRCVSGSDNC